MIIKLKNNSSFKTLVSRYFLDYTGIKTNKELKAFIKELKKQKNLKNDIIVDFVYKYKDRFIEHKYNSKFNVFELDIINNYLEN